MARIEIYAPAPAAQTESVSRIFSYPDISPPQNNDRSWPMSRSRIRCIYKRSKIRLGHARLIIHHNHRMPTVLYPVQHPIESSPIRPLQPKPLLLHHNRKRCSIVARYILPLRHQIAARLSAARSYMLKPPRRQIPTSSSLTSLT